MTLLLFSFTTLLVFVLIIISAHDKSVLIIRSTAILGILFGIGALGLNAVILDGFAKSTPVRLTVKNQSDQTLKIYTIIVRNYEEKGRVYRTTYGGRNPSHRTIKYTFENDGSEEFWIIGRSLDGNIHFLATSSENDSDFSVQLEQRSIADESKARKAVELCIERDRELLLNRAGVGANVTLLLVLFALFINVNKVI